MRTDLIRPALALSLAAAVAAGGVAVAAPAPKPVCNLITDPAGDTTGPSTALDIVGGDLASNGKVLTGVIRLAALAETDVSSPTGIAWGMRYTVPGSSLPKYLLATKFQGEAVEFSFGDVNGTSLEELGKGSGVLDVAKKEVRIHAPAKAVGAKPGAMLTELSAQGRRAIGSNQVATLYSNADASEAANARPYTAGTRSCITPGR